MPVMMGILLKRYANKKPIEEFALDRFFLIDLYDDLKCYLQVIDSND